MSNHFSKDIDPKETYDWLESIDSVIYHDGTERAKFLIKKLIERLKKNSVGISNNCLIFKERDYVNTIPCDQDCAYPGDLHIEKRIRSIIRWNAMMMVLRASKKNLDLGGHIATFQSIATIYEVCFHHFFRAKNKEDGGDLVYFQGHTTPGIYARAFLEGRLTEKQIDNFRQEIYEDGLSSYPHPKLMPEFWQFPTVSMGLGAINSIYQAKFLKYLQNRSLKNTSSQKVYAFLGDGEMDEPESKGAITVAAREKLDNLIFIVNCNLQRLDGPVVGNGKIINELENIFLGAGWEVIKVLWGSNWDNLFKKDKSGKLVQLMNETIDGEYQRLRSRDGKYIRENFFNKYPETSLLVNNMTEEEILNLNLGGHDPKKIFSALYKANNVVGKPSVILFQTIKGYGMGSSAEGMNIAHQVKKIDINGIKYFKDRLNLSDISDEKISSLPYLTIQKNSKEYIYLHERRKKLFGYIPTRRKKFTEKISLPSLEEFSFLLKEQKKDISTTIAFIRILNILLNNPKIKDRIVPIVADEARTFGMEGLFRKIGIYNSQGQKYIPQDREQVIYYREEKNGQILQEGINELGAMSSWLAASTSYSTNNFPMIPFYIYYSMFGFQRVGDLCWAAGDQQARGFLIGGTSGRTTLNGEGLQHEDGHSHIYSLTVPNCISYDPSYAYEVAVIIQNGLMRMYGEKQENVFFYLTVTNENYHMPSMPRNIIEGICKGIYKIGTKQGKENIKVQLMGSGPILRHVQMASEILFQEYKVSSDVYSVTSFTELARDGQNCVRWNMLHPHKEPKIPYISSVIENYPTVAATDYMKIFSEQIRNFIPTSIFYALGTDGFGRSDSRENLRYHFEVHTAYIVIAALKALSDNGDMSIYVVKKAIAKYNIDTEKINPLFL